MRDTEGIAGVESVDETASERLCDSSDGATELTREETADEAVGSIGNAAGDPSNSDEGVAANQTADLSFAIW
jgi:hypothetical protein